GCSSFRPPPRTPGRGGLAPFRHGGVPGVSATPPGSWMKAAMLRLREGRLVAPHPGLERPRLPSGELLDRVRHDIGLARPHGGEEVEDRVDIRRWDAGPEDLVASRLESNVHELDGLAQH